MQYVEIVGKNYNIIKVIYFLHFVSKSFENGIICVARVAKDAEVKTLKSECKACEQSKINKK